MKKIMKNFLILFGLIIIFLFFLHQIAYAQCVNPCSEPSSCSMDNGNDSTSYSCTGPECGQDIEQTVCDCYQDYTCSGTSWVSSGAPHCDMNCVTSLYEDCDTWEICNAANPSCDCSGNCLDSPVGSLLDGKGVISNTNVRLPIKLAWNQISGAQSYLFRAWKIDPPTTITWDTAEAKTSGIVNNGPVANKTSGILGNPIWVVPESGNETPCFLKLPDDTDYKTSTNTDWQVTPCCNSNGTNCKDWDKVPLEFFEVSLAPQLISPEDPDWNNTNQMAMDIPLPAKLSWCSVKEAQYYKINNYILNEGEEVPMGIVGNIYNSYYEDTWVYYFTPDKSYRWEAVSCFKIEGKEYCSSPSQKWGIKTTSTSPDAEFALRFPPNDTVNAIGVPVALQWLQPLGYYSFFYRVISGPEIISGTSADSGIVLDLNLNKIYSWTVNPCKGHFFDQCEGYVPSWQFKTTGQTPIIKNPSDGVGNVVLPVKLDWDDVSGAGLYNIEVTTDTLIEPFLNENSLISEISLGYPELSTSTTYYWRVKTCAYETKCGSPSSWFSFTTFDFDKPTIISPLSGELIEETSIGFYWTSVPGAQNYNYIILKNGQEIINKKTSNNSASHNSVEFPETGIYEWKVSACLDADCNASSEWSDLQSFNFNLIAPPEMRGGLVPCGKTYDDPDTVWNERESCGIKHLFLLLRNILSFFLWKIATIFFILILLAVAGMFYISKGETTIIYQIKSALKWSVVGYIIIFGAWFFVNLLLALLGYKFEFFGRWWDFPL